MLLAASGIALTALLSACSSGTSASSDSAANPATKAAGLTNIVVATPNTGFSPQSINFEIADYLGYYKQQGLQVTFENLGTPQAVFGALTTGKAQFAIMNDTSMAAAAAQGQAIGGTAFYEFTYPFKYGVAVNPSSKVKKLSQLKGTTVGTDSFGQSEYNVGQIMLAKSGVSATDVHWLATGTGVSSGQALQKGQISALFYSDAGFGSILSAGIPLRFLPIPKGVPQVGGQMVVASTKVWADQRGLATKMATAINETNTFILANPTAASYAYLKQFPTAAPPGNSLSDQIAAVSLPVQLRMKLYTPPAGHGLLPGEVYGQSFKDSLTFQSLSTSTNVSKLYSNAVAKASNKFNVAAVQKRAKNYKVPGIKGAVAIPKVPAGTP
jgi:NitT/TauT family transport system substrate-binding protein